jgi:site-specific recombinase XerD
MIITGKGGKKRILFLVPSVVSALEVYLEAR